MVNASGTTPGNHINKLSASVTLPDLEIVPVQAESAGVGTISSLSINTGNAGQSVALISSPLGGLHGLTPNTAYTIMWDGTTKVGSFTSTGTGEVPVGASFTVPNGTSGLHIVDLQISGVSAIYGTQVLGTDHGLQQFGGAACILTPTPPAVPQVTPPCEAAPSSTGLIYYDLIFDLLPLLTATPSLVGAGQTATAVGSGLPSSTFLYLVAPNSVSYASFTSTATGTVPPDVTFTVPQMPTTAGDELGTVEFWNIENAQSAIVGQLRFVYGATVTLSASSGSAGSSVTVTANGLNAGDSPFDVIFNCIPNNFKPFVCSGQSTNSAAPNQVAGALIPNSLGSASTTITIPAGTPSGTYVIQLAGPTLTDQWDLATPPSFTVGICTTCGFGTSSLTPGSPSQATLNENPDISLTYTDATTQSLTFIGYAVVTNALGEVVLYTTASATLSPSSSQTLYFVLAGLASASYTVTIYAISSNGVVLSTTTTTTAVIS